MKEVNAGDVVNVDCFKVEFIKVCHSIAEASALSITTPVGVVFVTGDFKIDFTPIDNKLTDLERIGEIGKKGVLLMLGESTNVERNGHTMSERTVGESFDVIFGKNQKKRMIVATFSTNNYRLQQLMDISVKYNRKVVLSGRSMKTSSIWRRNSTNLRSRKTLSSISTKPTNSRRSALPFLHGQSGRAYERAFQNVAGHFRQGYDFCDGHRRYFRNADPRQRARSIQRRQQSLQTRRGRHLQSVRRYPCFGTRLQGRTETYASLVRPKFFIPVHGEYRHLKLHQRLAGSMGIPEYNTFIPDVGNTVNVYKNKMVKGNNVPAGNNFIDGVALGENAETILRDRKALSDNGFIVILLTVRLKSGEILAGPDIILRGLHLGDTFPDEAKEVVLNALKQVDFENVEDIYELKTIIRKAIRKFIDKNYKQLPMILPIIIEA